VRFDFLCDRCRGGIIGRVGNVGGIARSIQSLYASSARKIIGSVIASNATYIGWITGKVSSAPILITGGGFIGGLLGGVTGALSLSNVTVTGGLISGSSYLGGLGGLCRE
jgi:hypothetical protein